MKVFSSLERRLSGEKNERPPFFWIFTYSNGWNVTLTWYSHGKILIPDFRSEIYGGLGGGFKTKLRLSLSDWAVNWSPYYYLEIKRGFRENFYGFFCNFFSTEPLIDTHCSQIFDKSMKEILFHFLTPK